MLLITIPICPCDGLRWNRWLGVDVLSPALFLVQNFSIQSSLISPLVIFICLRGHSLADRWPLLFTCMRQGRPTKKITQNALKYSLLFSQFSAFSAVFVWVNAIWPVRILLRWLIWIFPGHTTQPWTATTLLSELGGKVAVFFSYSVVCILFLVQWQLR